MGSNMNKLLICLVMLFNLPAFSSVSSLRMEGEWLPSIWSGAFLRNGDSFGNRCDMLKSAIYRNNIDEILEESKKHSDFALKVCEGKDRNSVEFGAVELETIVAYYDFMDVVSLTDLEEPNDDNSELNDRRKKVEQIIFNFYKVLFFGLYESINSFE